MRNLNAISLPALAIAGLMLIPAPDAAAHDVVYTDYRGRPVHVVSHRTVVFPPWLRQHRDFTNWYSLNYGYRGVNVSWQRLLRRYEGDYYYHRHYKPRQKARYKAWYKAGHKLKYDKQRHRRIEHGRNRHRDHRD
ncbi:MAG: hypothetical protein WBM54_13015 [Woeseia sp.]